MESVESFKLEMK